MLAELLLFAKVTMQAPAMIECLTGPLTPASVQSTCGTMLNDDNICYLVWQLFYVLNV